MKLASEIAPIALLVCGLQSCSDLAVESVVDNDVDGRDDYAAWTAVTVGVADLDEALALWVDEFGFNVVIAREGADADLEALWSLAAGDIARQALLRTNDNAYGMIHFVEFQKPGAPVRQGAQVFDRVPKNLDIYVHDLPARVEILREHGREFRTESHSEVTAPDGTKFREIHMPSHDDINVVLLEVVGQKKPFTAEGYAGVGPLIFIVPDAAVEKGFFASIFMLDKLSDNILEGPEIEKMIGLPPGAALDVSIWGREGIDLGGIEIVEYRGVTGDDLYPQAIPKSLGILHVTYIVRKLEPLLTRLEQFDVQVIKHGAVESVLGSGNVVSFATPAGLRIEVYEVDNSTPAN